jgi:hypothetical protein
MPPHMGNKGGKVKLRGNAEGLGGGAILHNGTNGGTTFTMAVRLKLLMKMRRNPRGDWTIEDFKAIAAHYQIEWRNPAGSHVVFVSASGAVLTVPARRPIKPIYVKMFVEMIDRCELKA